METDPDAIQAFMASLDTMEMHLWNHDWNLFVRPTQLRPEGEDWDTWVILAGRGFGKTRPGSETVIDWAIELGQLYGTGHIALLGKDPEDIRKVMIEGESGILSVSPPWFRPIFEPTKKQLTWPNGVKASYYSSEEPDSLRGPQHHKLWGDEICKWKKGEDMWDMASFGLRLGHNPQSVLTTTPRPVEPLLTILKEKGTIVTRGSTRDNQANLAPKFIRAIEKKYAGTRLGRQELEAELLMDTPGALWTREMIEKAKRRYKEGGKPPNMTQLTVAVDPGVTDPKDDPELMDDLAETGIVVAGRGEDGHLHVLHDFSGHFSPHQWGQKAGIHYETLKADNIVGEVNNGGDLVEFVIKTEAKVLGYDVNFKKVHASRGKRTRGEPVSAIYEQHRAHHWDDMPELEDQMATWVPGLKSPDRMDALVWAATEVMLLSPDDLVFA